MNIMKNMKPQINGRCQAGYFIPYNKLKYASDNKTIIYRSSLELKFCQECDTNPLVIRWISEPDFLNIKYVNPFKKRIATYYPDFYIQIKSKSGIVQAIIELKAHSMINLPKNGDISKMSMFMKRAFIINQAKKKAAEKICMEKNMKYLVITEKSDFFKNR